MQDILTLKSISGENRPILFLSPLQLKALNLSPGEIQLQVGEWRTIVEAMIFYHSYHQEVIPISPPLAAHLGWCLDKPLALVYSGLGRLTIGPSLALTVSRYVWNNLASSASLLQRARLAWDRGIILYIIRLSQVDWQNDLVTAQYLDPLKDAWIKIQVPVPRLIFDRGSIPGPSTVSGFKRKGQVTDLLWLNSPRTLGKWETYQALCTRGRCIMPETAILDPTTFLKFLNNYPFCYVKSNYGRNGREVGRILKSGKLFVFEAGGHKKETTVFAQARKLFAFLDATLGKGAIIQRGIELALWEDSPFDLRVLVQKNGTGNWQVTGVNCRIAAPGAVVTNFAAGARDMFFSPGQDLPRRNLSWHRIQTFALDAIQCLEKTLYPLGEVGLDIALDCKDKMWLLEANSRPSSIAYRNAPTEDRERIFSLPLDYARHLARQAQRTAHGSDGDIN